MPADREPPTITDYVVTALSPVLVMLMVGSLVFFLVEVLYAGKYSGSLLYTLFFFVAGAVLVARIAIQTDASRATIYGLLLGIVTYIALLTYVEYPGSGWLHSLGWLVNLGLMVLIWWSAHKLTWDCTHIDEKQKGAGRGVLSAAGLSADQKETGDNGQETVTRPISRNGQQADGTSKGSKKRPKAQPDSRLWDWIEKYKQHRDARRKGPHTPGVWVIYFALAALPLFALGQSLIDPDDDKRRRATFLQMAVYIASALGLLVTTSLLGLRRYLRQRKAKIPTALAGGWLGLGAVIIVVFLAIGAFLPRPHSEVPWFGIARAGKSDRQASKYALRKDGTGKGEGSAGNKSKAGNGSASGKNGQPGGGSSGKKGGGKGQEGKGGSGRKSDQSGGNKTGGGKGEGKDSQARKDESNSDRKDGSSSGENEENPEEKDDAGSDRNADSQSTSQLGETLQKVTGALKWIVFAVVAIGVVVVVVLGILRYLAPFTGWAQRLLDAIRNWWAGLFGKKEAKRTHEEAATTHPLPQRPPPFHAYANPFTDGSAEGRDAAELVAYTFEALDAWAWDQEQGRELPETPLEFLARLADEYPDLIEVLTPFARVYARVTYSQSDPPTETRAACEAMWDGMIHGVAVAT